MTTKYALFDPANGTYSIHDTVEELKVSFAERAYEFFLWQTHNTPYSLVCYSPDGSETWRTPQGDEILSPEQLKAGIELVVSDTLPSE